MVVIFRRRVPSKCGGADQRLLRWSPGLLSCWRQLAPLLRPSCRQRLPSSCSNITLSLVRHPSRIAPGAVDFLQASAVPVLLAARSLLRRRWGWRVGNPARWPPDLADIILVVVVGCFDLEVVVRPGRGPDDDRLRRRSARWSRQLPRHWPDHGVVGRKGMGAGRHVLIPGSKRCRRPLRRNLMSINPVSAPHATPGNAEDKLKSRRRPGQVARQGLRSVARMARPKAAQSPLLKACCAASSASRAG